MSITINGSGTITGISAGGLPDGSVTAADIESSLDLSGKTVTLPSGTGGKVLQVVNYGTFAETSASGATDVLTDLAVSITPSSTSSKILILANYSIGSSGQDPLSRLYRDSTALGSFIKSRPSSTWANFMNTHAINYLDSPSTTSAVTYAIYIRSVSAITYFNRNGASTINNAYSTITAMEIAG